jgi:hypothetical protein
LANSVYVRATGALGTMSVPTASKNTARTAESIIPDAFTA